MPRYYFNVYDGFSKLDTEGTDLPDLATARTTALHYAGDLIKDYAAAIISGEDWHLEVADKLGLVLFRLDVCTTDAPAVCPDPLTKRTPASP